MTTTAAPATRTPVAPGAPLVTRTAGWCTGLLAAATVALAVLALARPEWLAGLPSTVGSARGTALVLLVVATPTLLVGLWWAARGSLRGVVLWGGATTYIAYNGVIFAWGLPFGRTFPFAIAMLGLGCWTLLALLTSLDPARFVHAFRAGLPVRAIGGYLVAVSVAFALTWAKDIVPGVLSGGLSGSVAESGMSTNPVQVVDLALSLPACILAGVWLWQRRPWGYALAGILLLFNVIEALGVAVDQAFAHAADPTFPLAGVPLFLAVTAVQCVPTGVYLARLHDAPCSAPAPPPDPLDR